MAVLRAALIAALRGEVRRLTLYRAIDAVFETTRSPKFCVRRREIHVVVAQVLRETLSPRLAAEINDAVRAWGGIPVAVGHRQLVRYVKRRAHSDLEALSHAKECTADPRAWGPRILAMRARGQDDHRSRNVLTRTEHRTLAREWEERLRRYGGEDLAPLDDESGILRAAPAIAYEEAAARRSYAEAAMEYLHRADWPDRQERAIWERHAAGESIRKIAAVLGTYRTRVNDVIRRHRERCLAQSAPQCDDLHASEISR
ncbi:MAG TPA: hypothetical protein VFJ24_01660 [Gaiellales bacterium]|nr:hypothetical protein [Gaiellales bacterium]